MGYVESDSLIIGKWVREANYGIDFFYRFYADGTFETDEIPDQKLARGVYYQKGPALVLRDSKTDDMYIMQMEVSNSRLVLTLQSGDELIYKRA